MRKTLFVLFLLILGFFSCSSKTPFNPQMQDKDYPDIGSLIRSSEKTPLKIGEDYNTEMSPQDCHIFIKEKNYRTAARVFEVYLDAGVEYRLKFHTISNALGFEKTIIVPAMLLIGSDGMPVIPKIRLRGPIPPTFNDNFSFMHIENIMVSQPGNYYMVVMADLSSNESVAWQTANKAGKILGAIDFHRTPYSKYRVSYEPREECVAHQQDESALSSKFKDIIKNSEQGDAEAQFLLGLRYDNGDEVSRNQNQAACWWTKAAEQGHVKAQYNLGTMYSLGEVESIESLNYQQAIHWFRKSAEQGYDSAQFAVAKMYYFGEGVPQNYILAYVWSTLATAQGFKTDKTAIKLREKAAEKLSPLELSEALELIDQIQYKIDNLNK